MLHLLLNLAVILPQCSVIKKIWLYFADWCVLFDIRLCDGCSLCLGHFQTVLPRDRGESLQVWEECESFCWVGTSASSCSHLPFINDFSKHTNFVCANTPRDEQNILEAASNGASASIGLVANIAANLIAFLAILGFINSALSWLGGMVGYPEVTFQVWKNKLALGHKCSYIYKKGKHSEQQ